MIDCNFKNPVAYTTGFLLLFSLAACQSIQTPEQTTLAFWSAIASNDLNRAKKHCSTKSQHLLSSSPDQNLKNLSFNFGKIVIDNDKATVETQIISTTDKMSSFTTFLIKENKLWKVDYQRSSADLAGSRVFKEFFKELNIFGEKINNQLEQQLPLIKKEIESFAEQLNQQIDNFENDFKKPVPQKRQNKYQNTI